MNTSVPGFEQQEQQQQQGQQGQQQQGEQEQQPMNPRSRDWVEGKVFLGGLNLQTAKETVMEYCQQW